MTDIIMEKTIQHFKNFKTEQAVYDFLKNETEKIGCSLSFEPIVASGKNASMPHSSRRGRLQKGFCVIDYGLKYKGYCTDITRTIYIGKPNRKDVQIYEKVLTVQEEAIRMSQANVKCSRVFDFVRKSLGKNFTHSLGHGVGLQIHELPNISSFSKEKFAENMVFTIEPGIYIPGKLGIRIEDDVMIKDGEPVVLTKTEKQLIIIQDQIK
jgi:Xaa-Pro dipeptidase